jgi:hypothetical protein
MVGDKIKYTCKNCGWFTSIREEWGDLKPKRCMNKKCNTSFLKYPDSLIIQVPDAGQPEVEAPSKPRKRAKSETPND